MSVLTQGKILRNFREAKYRYDNYHFFEISLKIHVEALFAITALHAKQQTRHVEVTAKTVTLTDLVKMNLKVPRSLETINL